MNEGLEISEVIYAIVVELVDELNWSVREDHKELAVKALRSIGLPDAYIEGYFSGNLIL